MAALPRSTVIFAELKPFMLRLGSIAKLACAPGGRMCTQGEPLSTHGLAPWLCSGKQGAGGSAEGGPCCSASKLSSMISCEKRPRLWCA